MKGRRPFLVFILLRFLAWGTVTAMIIAVLIGNGSLAGVPFEALIGAAIGGIVVSYFEFDSLPRQIAIRDGALIVVDPSGEERVTSEFGIRRFLWLTRLVACRDREVITIPLEAYEGASELGRAARGERGMRFKPGVKAR